MLRRLLFFFTILSFQCLFAQKEGNIWYFGVNAGVDFNSGAPVALTDGQLSSQSSCAVISDSDGVLLFYTDGVTVWNKNHQVMSNGTGLNGDLISSQGSTIMQKPGSSTIYYIFTLGYGLNVNGFCYSEVDLSLSGGLGAVTTKNNLIKHNISEKLAISPHSNGMDYWVVVHGVETEYFLSYLVTSSGVSTTPIGSNVGASIAAIGSQVGGIMKFSPDGTRVAISSNAFPGRVELFDFNQTTGVVSNLRDVTSGTSFFDTYYGIEFSPDGNLLYCSRNAHYEMLQFNLNASNIPSSVVTIHQAGAYTFGALQLGPDGKIYISDSIFTTTLSVINSPNTIGMGCNLQLEAIDLDGRGVFVGLPTIHNYKSIPLFHTATPLCSGVDVVFDFDTTLPIDSVLWEFGDGTVSSVLNPTHTYTTSGTYTVTLTITSNLTTYVRHTEVEATLLSTPLPVLSSTPQFCIQETKTLADISITGQNIQWYDALTGGNLLPDTTLLVDGVSYYASQIIDGCESGRLAVAVTINNTPHPIGFAVQYFCETQTLADFVVTGTDIIFYDSMVGGNMLPITTSVVHNMAYWVSQTLNGCESMSRLALVSDITGNVPANDFSMNACDNLNDGKEKTDLSFYNENIVPASHGYSFSYYTDFASADNGTAANEITDFTDYELLPGVNSIYVRVSNTTPCYKVVELRLTLIPAPVLQMKDTYFICVGRSVTITADPGFHTYTWSDTSLGQSMTVTEPGTYSVTVTEFHGDVICGTTKTITVVASDKPTITSIETSDWTAYENMLTVIVSGVGNYEYSLDGEHYQLSNQFTGLPNGEYTVHVRDINGCGVDHEDVYLLMYPKFFTPNGDSYNDAWGIKFYKNEPNMVVKIFDRYGKFIKQLTDTDPLWDGTYNGQALPATDYWFSVVRENRKEFIGHFSLKR